jgi:uncharacterized membrane protein YadS
MRTLAVLAAAVPFGFGLIRLAQTGSDARYLIVAATSLCGAAAVVVLRRASQGTRSSGSKASTVAAVFLAATVMAVAGAMLLGTHLGPGILVVAASFGFCFAIASAIYLHAPG